MGNEVLDIFNKKNKDKLLLSSTVVGSCLYGNNTSYSDVDVVFAFVSPLGKSLLENKREVVKFKLPNIKDIVVGHNILSIINHLIEGNFGNLPLLFDHSKHNNLNVRNYFYNNDFFKKFIVKNRHLLFSNLIYEKCFKQSKALIYTYTKLKEPKYAVTAIRNLMVFKTIEYDENCVNVEFKISEQERYELLSIKDNNNLNDVIKIYNNYLEKLKIHSKKVKLPEHCDVKSIEDILVTFFHETNFNV